MSTTQTEPAGADTPDSVTYRELQEIIRTFHGSRWTAMTLELAGMRVTVGKEGPPSSAASTPPVAAPAPAPAAPVGPETPLPGAAPHPSAARASDPPRDGPLATSSTPRQSAEADITGCVAVTSPAVGAFWVAPSPGQPPFVQVGHTVAQEDQLGIIEVMKLMNPVVATTAGEIVQVCADNAEMVEYEQVLFWIRPTDG